MFWHNFDFSQENATKLFPKCFLKANLEDKLLGDQLSRILNSEVQKQFDEIQHLVKDGFYDDAALNYKKMLIYLEMHYDHSDLVKIVNAFVQFIFDNIDAKNIPNFYHKILNVCESCYGSQSYFVTFILNSLLPFYDASYLQIDEILECSSEITENTKFLQQVIYHFSVISQINKNWDTAEFYLKKLIKTFEKDLKIDDSNFVDILNELATICIKQENFFEAEQISRRVLNLIYEETENFAESDLTRAKTFLNLAYVFQLQERNIESKYYFQKALKFYDEKSSDDKTLADILYNLGKVLLKTHKYEHEKEIEKCFRRALEIRKRILDSMDLDLADALYSMAKYVANYSTNDEYEKLIEQARIIYEANLGPNSPRIGDIYYAIGKRHVWHKYWEYRKSEDKKDDDDAEIQFEEIPTVEKIDPPPDALQDGDIQLSQNTENEKYEYCFKAIKKYEFNKNYKKASKLHYLLADMNYCIGKNMAEFHFLQLLKIYETHLDVDDNKIADTEYELAVRVYKRQKNYEKAVLYLNKSLKRFQKEPIANNSTISSIFLSLGDISTKQEKFKEALDHYETGLKYDKLSSHSGYTAAKILKNFGIVYQNLERFDQAEISFLDSLEMYRSFTEKELKTAEILYHLALLYKTQKQYKKAKQFITEGIKLYEEHSKSDNSKFAAALQLYTEILIKTQKYFKVYFIKTRESSKAEMYGLRALEMEENNNDGNGFNIAAICHLLGIACHFQELFEEAKDYCTRALKIFDVMKPAKLEYAKIYATFGTIYTELKNFDKAETNFINAIEIFEADSNTDVDDIIEVQYNCGKMYEKCNKDKKAESCFLKAVDLFDPNQKHLFEEKILKTLADFYFDRKKYNSAEMHYLNLLVLFKSEFSDQKEAVYYRLAEISEINQNCWKAKKCYTSLILLDCGPDAKAKLYYKLGRMCKNLSDYDTAKNYLLKSLKIIDKGKTYKIYDEILPEILGQLSSICLYQGDGVEAEQYSLRFLNFNEDEGNIYEPGPMLNNAALACKMLGRFDEAEKYCHRSISIYEGEEEDEIDDEMVAKALQILVEIYLDQYKYDEIEICISRLLNIFKFNLHSNFGVAANVLYSYSKACYKIKSGNRHAFCLIEQLLKTLPNDSCNIETANSLLTLSNIYEFNKKSKEAKKILQMAIKIYEANNLNVAELKNRLKSLQYIWNRIKRVPSNSIIEKFFEYKEIIYGLFCVICLLSIYISMCFGFEQLNRHSK